MQIRCKFDANRIEINDCIELKKAPRKSDAKTMQILRFLDFASYLHRITKIFASYFGIRCKYDANTMLPCY